jgi:hypothetical protein
MKKGLRNLDHDERDFNLGAISPVVKDIPREFLVTGAETLKVKDQGNTDYCSAYACTSASELQEGVELNPEYHFAKSKQLQGEFKSWGCDLRTACKVSKKIGDIEQTAFEQVDKSKNLRDWNNWKSYFDMFARKHRKQSFFRVDLGFGDKFEMIKSAMYQYDLAIISGIEWKPSYTFNETGELQKYEKGIIRPSNRSGFGHAILIIGVKIIEGKEYLIIHNSIGDIHGNDGRWYLPREMVNELRFGNFVMPDISEEDAKYMLKRNIQINDDWVTRIIKNFKFVIKR